MRQSPELGLRTGNASLCALAKTTLDELQRIAAAENLWLPVDLPGHTTVGELAAGRDGGPREACYGRLRDRILAAEMHGYRFGSEAVKDVAGLDLRRALLGSEAVGWVVFRLARVPRHRLQWRALGGAAFALADALRADPAAPAALVVTELDELMIASDHDDAEDPRRRELITRLAAGHEAELAPISHREWLERCAALPAPRARSTGTLAQAAAADATGAWAFDAGRRLAHGVIASANDRPPPAGLVSAVTAVLR